MKLSLNWLKKHIPDFEIADNQQFKNRIDTRLSEVEEVKSLGDKLHMLVIGEIVEVEKHPSSDKLVVCKVNIGESKPVQIVCGAPNAVVGLYSVVCLPGGRVYPDMKIEKREVAGVMSEGMLCAMDELGLWPDHNKIIEVDQSLSPGTEVTELFKDVSIEIENKAVPHRPDVFSHRGIAREIGAIFKTELMFPEYELPSLAADIEDPLTLKVSVQSTKLCWRYGAVAFKNIKIGPSPLWLQIALAYSGMKPVNNVVDITNYVMHDIGLPLHAFDLSKLASPEIIVREAKKGEKLVTLDHNERELSEGMLIIADKNGPIGVAGVMGGLNTEITQDTNQIVLEAANFEMYSIRRTARRLGLRSEAVTRFEKGVDPEGVPEAIARAAQLLKDVCGAEMCSEIVDEYPNPLPQKTIDIELLTVRKALGVEIDKSRMVQILESLGFEVIGLEKVQAGNLSRQDVSTPVQIVVPSFRRDINADYDIVEEIGRIFGYEHVPITVPKRDLNTPVYNEWLHVSTNAKKVLAAAGLQEVVTYSMVGADLNKPFNLSVDELLAIPDPISPELGYLRKTLLPSLLEKVQLNMASYKNFGLFEISRVVINSANRNKDELPSQPYKLAGMRIGEDAETTYRQLKYALESLQELVQGKLEIKPVSTQQVGKVPNYFHPRQVGAVYLGSEIVGYIGNLHPLVLHGADITNKTIAAFEIDFDPVIGYQQDKRQLQPISNFPAVERDISFWQKPQSYVGEVINSINALNIPDLKRVELIDRYENKEQSRTSVTLGVTLQSSDHTLTQSEINSCISEIAAVISGMGHELR